MKKNNNDLTWGEILFQVKFWIALFLGISPLLTLVYFALFDKLKENYLIVTLGLISFQVGFALNLIYVIIKDSKRKDSSEITDIKSQVEFWKEGASYEELIVFSMNANRFIEAIVNNKIKINTIKLIFPCSESVKIFYSNYNNIINKEDAIQSIIKSIDGVEHKLKQAQEDNLITNYEIKKTGTFPSSFLAIFDGSKCLHGKYIPDKYRKDTIGLKSASWLVKDPRKIFYLQQYFNNLWQAI